MRRFSSYGPVDNVQHYYVPREALLETANIRLGYTKVTVDWTGGDDQRIVVTDEI